MREQSALNWKIDLSLVLNEVEGNSSTFNRRDS
jgi:hypothetical protein